MKQWHGRKGSQRRNSNEDAYASNWEKIFGEKKKKIVSKVRKTTPSHGLTQVQKDKTKYDRKNFKLDEV